MHRSDSRRLAAACRRLSDFDYSGVDAGNDVRIEVELPVTFTGASADLQALLAEAGVGFKFVSSEEAAQLPEGCTGSPLLEVLPDAVSALGALGGLGGIATVLKVFFDRHKIKKIRFGEAGELIETEGLTAGDVERLLRALEQKRRLELEDGAS